MNLTAGTLSAEWFPFLDVRWEVPNFFQLSPLDGYYVDSPPFLLAGSHWCLRIYPNGRWCQNSAGFIDLDIIRLNFSSPRQRIVYKIGFVTRRGKEFESYSDDDTMNAEENDTGVFQYISRTKLMQHRQLLVPNGSVTVFCQMRVEASALWADSRGQQGVSPLKKLNEASSQTEMLVSDSPAEKPGTSASVQQLQSDLKNLLQREEDSDVCLKVSDKEFRAHKCILRARSAVFSAMFKHETEEKNSGEVVIEDLDPDSFPGFLQHLYTGRVESLSEENVFDLFSAADKYGMLELKSECREHIERTLSVDTFTEVVILALRYQEQNLLNLAIDFFSKHMTAVIMTVKWQIFSKNYNTEANELLIKALGSREKSLELLD